MGRHYEALGRWDTIMSTCPLIRGCPVLGLSLEGVFHCAGGETIKPILRLALDWSHLF